MENVLLYDVLVNLVFKELFLEVIFYCKDISKLSLIIIYRYSSIYLPLLDYFFILIDAVCFSCWVFRYDERTV